MELGEAAMYANPLMSTVIDHPYISGAVIGVGTGLAAVGGSFLLGQAGLMINTTAVSTAQKIIEKASQSTIGVESLKIVPKAQPKLEYVSRVIGKSTDFILKEASKSRSIFQDMLHDGNINIYFPSPVNESKFIRVTIDPTMDSIISAGFNSAKEIIRYLENNRFIPFNQ